MKYLFILITSVLSLSFYGQTQSDTAEKIYNANELKKGFYKNYREFITNSPSITNDFIVKERNLLALSITNNVSPYGYYVTKGEVDEMDVYGFCDGKNVYISQRGGLGYNKLEYLGPYCFYSYTYHRGLSATLPDKIVVIDENKKFKVATVKYVGKLLQSKNPVFASEYEKESDKKGKRKEYLIKLNEYLKSKK